jgi:hypothetical protein
MVLSVLFWPAKRKYFGISPGKCRIVFATMGRANSATTSAEATTTVPGNALNDSGAHPKR